MNYAEFLHIAIPADAPTRSLSERGLRDGSLTVAGILHRRSAARIRATEVLCGTKRQSRALCQLSFEGKKLSVVWAALLGVPLPLCSCGVIPYGYWSEKRKGFEGSHCLASASANTLSIKGSATEEAIRAAVEGIGYTFKGKA